MYNLSLPVLLCYAQALRSETSYCYCYCFLSVYISRTVPCGALYTACVDASRTVFWDRSPTPYPIFTARKRSCGKVMFLHLCVILFTGESLSRGSLSRVSVWGLCKGGSLSGRPPYGTEWAVPILLECILVLVVL